MTETEGIPETSEIGTEPMMHAPGMGRPHTALMIGSETDPMRLPLCRCIMVHSEYTAQQQASNAIRTDASSYFSCVL